LLVNHTSGRPLQTSQLCSWP